jgi:hypothetical protein
MLLLPPPPLPRHVGFTHFGAGIRSSLTSWIATPDAACTALALWLVSVQAFISSNVVPACPHYHYVLLPCQNDGRPHSHVVPYANKVQNLPCRDALQAGIDCRSAAPLCLLEKTKNRNARPAVYQLMIQRVLRTES